MQRTASFLAKPERLRKRHAHQQGGRVPLSDFFWGGFLQRWRAELGLARAAGIYRCYDLGWQVTLPRMHPHIRESEEEVVVRTGFGAVLRKKFGQAMPGYLSFETATLEMPEQLQFDDFRDGRRFFRAGDNQLGGAGGYNFQSGRSLPGNASAPSHDHVLRLVRRHGVYPLAPGEHTIAGLH